MGVRADGEERRSPDSGTSAGRFPFMDDGARKDRSGGGTDEEVPSPSRWWWTKRQVPTITAKSTSSRPSRWCPGGSDWPMTIQTYQASIHFGEPCVRSLIRLSSRLTLFSVIGATFEPTGTLLRTLSGSLAIIQSSSSTIPNTRYPLCGLLNAQSLHFEALNQPPFFPCPGRRRPSANRRTGCGQENHHPQVRTNKHRRRRANAPYPRRDSEHEAAARTSSFGSIVWFLVSLPHKPSGLISWLELFVRGICYILCVVRHPRKTSRLVGVIEFSVTKHTYYGGLHRLLVLTNPTPSPARFPDFTRGVPCFVAGERTNQPTGARSYCFALLPSLLSDSAPSSFAAPSFAVPALLSCPSNNYTKRTTQCIWSTYDYCSRQTPFHTPPPISLKLQSSFFSRIPCEEERSGLDNLQATTSTGPSSSGRRGRRSSVSSFNKALPTLRISPHIASSGSLGAKRDYAHHRLHSATCAGELLDPSRAATGVSVSHKRSTVTRLGRLD
ncbi:hypothetical protein CCUS01_14831 [Colletotrichum cuscutae]|uniref:Uncharacterized protein n=1 Tax=Colletotrichum cuscutae TaxID=1209917 RepID=A0AAI9VGT6_9PEZI|nr:hypothetical protein CCUS01_14831 [Colletotrichum cuscutae]